MMFKLKSIHSYHPVQPHNMSGCYLFVICYVPNRATSSHFQTCSTRLLEGNGERREGGGEERGGNGVKREEGRE